MRENHDVTHHAEVVALRQALGRLRRASLEDCTIYANTEPCALCSYAMRGTRIGRVVFGIPAPLTGGLSRWNILADAELSKTLPEVFAPPPDIVAGFMRQQAEAAIARRTPIAWDFIRARNIFGGPLPAHLLEECQSTARSVSKTVGCPFSVAKCSTVWAAGEAGTSETAASSRNG